MFEAVGEIRGVEKIERDAPERVAFLGALNTLPDQARSRKPGI